MILVVDDEILVRMAVSAYLRDLRYEVIEAANGDEALSVLSAIAPIDLMITDVTMPGTIDGLGLALALRVRRDYPSMNVLVISGIAQSLPNIAFMAKPFSFEELGRRAADLLGRVESAGK